MKITIYGMSKLREAIDLEMRGPVQPFRVCGLEEDESWAEMWNRMEAVVLAHEAAEAARWAEVRELLEGGLQMMPLKGSAGVNSIKSALALIPPAPAVEPRHVYGCGSHRISQRMNFQKPPPEKCAR